MKKSIRFILIGFLVFFTFSAFVLGIVLFTDLDNNDSSNYVGPGIIAFILVLLGVVALISGVVITLIRR
ncbi:MAG: hypothetical protein ACFFAU_14105 [Candidatus Hodarchaeota archaeon]